MSKCADQKASRSLRLRTNTLVLGQSKSCAHSDILIDYSETLDKNSEINEVQNKDKRSDETQGQRVAFTYRTTGTDVVWVSRGNDKDYTFQGDDDHDMLLAGLKLSLAYDNSCSRPLKRAKGRSFLLFPFILK